MITEDCNCFVKQFENTPWLPAVKKLDGKITAPNGYLLPENPFAVRDATYEQISAEMATRGEQ